MSSVKEKMHTGELYLPGDEEIVEDQTKRLDRLYDYNMTRPTEGEKREAMLKEMFAEIGRDAISNRRSMQTSGEEMSISENTSMLILI